MTAIKLSIDRLSPEALQGVIDEFVSRDGTDYGMTEAALETKIQQVKRQLTSGHAVLVYDSETKTCNIFPADNPEARFT